jgi:hypothetical protein
MWTSSELVFKIAKKPDKFLIDKSLNSLLCFELGVDAGLAYHNKPHLRQVPSRDFFFNWVLKDFETAEEHRKRLNGLNCLSPTSYSILMSNGQEDAFDIYIRMLKEACLVAPKSNQDEDNSNYPSLPFFEFIESVKKRPGMYSLEWNIIAYENILNGFIFAEEKLLNKKSTLSSEITDFKKWLDERYPFGIGRPFSKVISFVSVGHRLAEIDFFEEHYEMFTQKLPSDTPDKTNALMKQNILKHIENLDQE